MIANGVADSVATLMDWIEEGIQRADGPKTKLYVDLGVYSLLLRASELHRKRANEEKHEVLMM